MSIKEQIFEKIDLERGFDIFFRKLKLDYLEIELLFLTPLVDSLLLLETIKNIKTIKNKDELELIINTPQVKKVNDVNEALSNYYYGCALIFIEEEVFFVDIKKLPIRSIDEPYSEKAIRGSRDGFNESINTNIGLIRLRIKSHLLRSEIFTVSKYGKTSVCLVYLEDKVDQNILNTLRKRIEKINVNSLIMSDRSLEEKLFNQSKYIYPLVRYTERPDVASIHVMNGKVIILVDTSSSALITPICLFDHFKHVEEFRQTPIIGTFTKFLRFIAVIVSLFLSPTILALALDHDYSNFYLLDLNMRSGEISFQFIVATLIIEIFRIAVVHTPTPIVGGISLVSALVLGQVSIELGIFSSEVLLVVCLSAICGFATPSYELSLSNKLVSLLLLLIVSIFKMEGYIVSLIALFLYVVSINTFGVPYLYPLCPFDYKKVKDPLIRKSSNDKKNI